MKVCGQNLAGFNEIGKNSVGKFGAAGRRPNRAWGGSRPRSPCHPACTEPHRGGRAGSTLDLTASASSIGRPDGQRRERFFLGNHAYFQPEGLAEISPGLIASRSTLGSADKCAFVVPCRGTGRRGLRCSQFKFAAGVDAHSRIPLPLQGKGVPSRLHPGRRSEDELALG